MGLRVRWFVATVFWACFGSNGHAMLYLQYLNPLNYLPSSEPPHKDVLSITQCYDKLCSFKKLFQDDAQLGPFLKTIPTLTLNQDLLTNGSIQELKDFYKRQPVAFAKLIHNMSKIKPDSQTENIFLNLKNEFYEELQKQEQDFIIIE